MVGFVKSPVLVTIGYSIASMYVFSLKYILSTTKSLVQEDLELTDTEAGLIYTIFVVATMISCPIMGYVADMALYYKKYIALGGLILDAFAVIILAFCRNFYILLIPRIFSGIGDGAFSTIAPPILSDYFPPAKRNMVLTIFLSISNIGAALGFTLAGSLGDLYGWRYACVIMGIPGFLGFLLLIFKDPESLAKPPARHHPADPEMSNLYDSDGDDSNDAQNPAALKSSAAATATTTSSSKNGDDVTEGKNSESTGLVSGKDAEGAGLAELMGDLGRIFSAPYVVSVVGFMFIGFAMAGLADWGTSFFVRYFDLSTGTAGTVCGLMTVVCALVGTVLGGIVCEYVGKVLKRHPQLLVSSITLLAGAVALLVPLLGRSIQSVLVICAFFSGGIVLSYIYYGPMNAYIINSVPPELRSRATGIMYFCRHLGGSFASSVVGAVSDASRNDLRTALTVVPFAILTAGIIWLYSFIAIPADAEKLLAGEKTVSDGVVAEDEDNNDDNNNNSSLKHNSGEKTPLTKTSNAESSAEPTGIILDK